MDRRAPVVSAIGLDAVAGLEYGIERLASYLDAASAELDDIRRHFASLRVEVLLEKERLPPRRLLTIQEVATQLALSMGTVKELVRTGRLRSVKIGGARRVAVEAIDSFLEELGGDAAAGQ